MRDHLLEERVVPDLGPQDVEQHGAHEVVRRAHRLGVHVPLGIDAGRHQQPFVHEPELPEPVPAPVTRQEPQQVVELGGKRIAVVVGGQQPGRGALIDVNMARLVHQAGDELRRAGPCPDDRNAPSRQIHRVVPGGGVEGGAVEALAALNGRKGRPVELPHRADDAVELLGQLGPAAVPHGQRPGAGLVVEAGLGHVAGQADALGQFQVLGRRLQVRQEVRLGREAGGPVIGLREGEAVELVGDVNPAARIHVLKPGPAHVGVLLEHGDRHTGLAQAVGGRQP